MFYVTLTVIFAESLIEKHNVRWKFVYIFLMEQININEIRKSIES